MQGYLNNPKKTSDTILIHSDGTLWLHSGDIGYMDSDGRVYPLDRADRMIKKGIDGFKMLPQHLEDAISSNPYVASCVVVGFNTKNRGVVAKAYIVLKEEIENSEEILLSIKKTCSEKLSERQIPDIFEFINELPYTPMGKIDYKRLEKGLEDEEKTPIQQENKKSLVKSLFKRR